MACIQQNWAQFRSGIWFSCYNSGIGIELAPVRVELQLNRSCHIFGIGIGVGIAFCGIGFRKKFLWRTHMVQKYRTPSMFYRIEWNCHHRNWNWNWIALLGIWYRIWNWSGIAFIGIGIAKTEFTPALTYSKRWVIKYGLWPVILLEHFNMNGKPIFHHWTYLRHNLLSFYNICRLVHLSAIHVKYHLTILLSFLWKWKNGFCWAKHLQFIAQIVQYLYVDIIYV